MTEERLARIRAWLDSQSDILPRERSIEHTFALDLLAHLDAVTRERDELKAMLEAFGADPFVASAIRASFPPPTPARTAGEAAG